METDLNERKFLISALSEELISTPAFLALRRGLLALCKVASLDRIETTDELVAQCSAMLERTDLKRDMQNAVFTRLKGLTCNKHNVVEYVPEEPDWIVAGRIRWLKRVSKGLESLATELGIPNERNRSPEKAREINRKWNDLSTIQHDLAGIRPIYAPRDLYDACKSAVDEANAAGNGKAREEAPLLGEMSARVPLQTFQDATKQYWTRPMADGPIKIAQIDIHDALHCRALLKSPIGAQTNRPKLWAGALQRKVTQSDRAQYEILRRQVVEKEFLSDKLLIQDVRSTAGNDDFYFVFEDYILQCLMVFSRDEQVCETSSQALLMTAAESDTRYPPSKVLPFYGFSFYCAPICFLYSDPVCLYLMFRQIYLRYFIRLHSIAQAPFLPPGHKFYHFSDNSMSIITRLADIDSETESNLTDEDDQCQFSGHGIIGLAHQFEFFFKERDPTLYQHLIKIGSKPTLVAFRWLVRAFSGVLQAAEVLRLWDYIIGHDSLQILALFAVGVFVQRRDYLIGANSSQVAEAILSDLSTLKVEPVLTLLFET